MATIMDVARVAGVGIGTVSRVLNGSPLVSEATRRRVLAAIDQLGYQPSPIARAFGRRRTEKIELIVPLFAQSFALEVLRGIEDALAETDYTLLIRSVEDSLGRERVFEECCVRSRADGALLVWLAPTRALADRLTAEGFPVVLINALDRRLWSVGVDHDGAAHRAVAHCMELGHRRIGLVDRREDPFDAQSGGVCQRGYRTTLADAGLPIRAEYEHLADFSAAGGAAVFDLLADLTERPTAIVASSETQALGALEAAHRRGWRVPADVSVVGYNDSPLARDFGLTTVSVPLRDMGRQATELLLAALAEPDADPIARFLPTQLVVRQTCGPPPAASSI